MSDSAEPVSNDCQTARLPDCQTANFDSKELRAVSAGIGCVCKALKYMEFFYSLRWHAYRFPKVYRHLINF